MYFSKIKESLQILRKFVPFYNNKSKNNSLSADDNGSRAKKKRRCPFRAKKQNSSVPFFGRSISLQPGEYIEELDNNCSSGVSEEYGNTFFKPYQKNFTFSSFSDFPSTIFSNLRFKPDRISTNFKISKSILNDKITVGGRIFDQYPTVIKNKAKEILSKDPDSNDLKEILFWSDFTFSYFQNLFFFPVCFFGKADRDSGILHTRINAGPLTLKNYNFNGRVANSIGVTVEPFTSSLVECEYFKEDNRLETAFSIARSFNELSFLLGAQTSFDLKGKSSLLSEKLFDGGDSAEVENSGVSIDDPDDVEGLKNKAEKSQGCEMKIEEEIKYEIKDSLWKKELVLGGKVEFRRFEAGLNYRCWDRIGEMGIKFKLNEKLDFLTSCVFNGESRNWKGLLGIKYFVREDLEIGLGTDTMGKGVMSMSLVSCENLKLKMNWNWDFINDFSKVNWDIEVRG